MTALFCDLVGFTALSESADPEDVDRMLTRYFAMARSAIEAFGGVVEKFIGDAVVGVFGVPAAHEDDPERAVRAGLRIAEDAESLTSLDGGPLRLRVGINTGETLVRLGVVPGSGERFLAGDAINTASRIQSVAPLMGVAVGQSTYDTTRAVFDYADLPPASLKGKSEPVTVFHAVAPRARLGTDVTRVHDGPFVGREIDLALLRGVFDKTVAATAVQLVTIVGDPGMGKSRLVAELSRHVDARPELVTWRQGRCLPYGDGITYWALSEVVKAHAGILDSDSAEAAQEKLEAVLPDAQRSWYRQRLLPLIGVAASSTAEREELFAAWTGFLEHVADDGPTVVVLEDLHWADEPMLDFLEHLADHAEGVPLLIVGTARPELFEHHASYGSGLRNATTISLAALTDDETSRLISGLLDAVAVPAEVQAGVLERAGGNPLFVEEYTRLLQDRGLLVPAGSTWELVPGVEVPLPSSVQALIAARIDTLSPDAKTLVADAAVVGKVFWDGALVAMSGNSPDTVTAALRELTRKQLVRSSRRSSVADQHEYAFWHVLTRDVAYSQLPRAARAAKHIAAAYWIEGSSADRLEDVADVLAFHHSTALDLARTTGDVDLVAREEPLARQFLIVAGTRARGLDPEAALARFRRALELTPPDSDTRAETLTLLGEAAHQAARPGEAEEALSEAVELLRAHGNTLALGRALSRLSDVLILRADGRWSAVSDEALWTLEQLPPGPELLDALGGQVFKEIRLGRPQEAIACADRALTLAADAGLPPPARALGVRGSVRALLGDAGGIADLRASIDLLTEAGRPASLAAHYSNLGGSIGLFEGHAAALAALREGIDVLRSRGLTTVENELGAEICWSLVETGQFREASDLAAALHTYYGRAGNVAHDAYLLGAEFRMWLLTGDPLRGLGLLPGLLDTTRATENAEDLVNGLGPAAVTHAALGERDEALTLLEEIAATPGILDAPSVPAWLPWWIRAAIDLGEPDLAAQIVGAFEPRFPLGQFARTAARAALVEVQQGPSSALTAYLDVINQARTFGSVIEEGFARLGHGRCLVRLGRTAEAVDGLQHARIMFASLGARPALAEIDSLLGEITRQAQ